jgi:hypothetical protein
MQAKTFAYESGTQFLRDSSAQTLMRKSTKPRPEDHPVLSQTTWMPSSPMPKDRKDHRKPSRIKPIVFTDADREKLEDLERSCAAMENSMYEMKKEFHFAGAIYDSTLKAIYEELARLNLGTSPLTPP